MAFDKSPVNNALIFKLMGATLVTLIGLKLILDSYFISATEEAKANAHASPEALIKLRAEEKKALAGAQTPIAQAVATLSKGSREKASLIVRPMQSDDIGAMKGWSKMPKAFDPAIVGSASVAAESGVPGGSGVTTPAAAATHHEAGH